jgi:hypothetical protein
MVEREVDHSVCSRRLGRDRQAPEVATRDVEDLAE